MSMRFIRKIVRQLVMSVQHSANWHGYLKLSSSGRRTAKQEKARCENSLLSLSLSLLYILEHNCNINNSEVSAPHTHTHTHITHTHTHTHTHTRTCTHTHTHKHTHTEKALHTDKNTPPQSNKDLPLKKQ